MADREPLLVNDTATTLRFASILEKAQRTSRHAHKKEFEFFVMYNSRGLDGSQLPDAAFATELRHKLQNEIKINGEHTRVGYADAAANNNMELVLQKMCRSFVILVVFSEATLRTFAGDATQGRQNDYLLMLQFASALFDERGVRIIGLNLMAIDRTAEEVKHFKCEGWLVQYKDIPHCSQWVNDSIKKTMDRIFAIQGIDVDPEDWDYRIPELCAGLYAFQDEISASGWISVFSIIPWKAMRILFWTFVVNFCCTCCGLCYACCVYGNNRTPKQHRHAILNVALFTNGLSVVIFGIVFAYLAGGYSPPAAICSGSPSCQLSVMSGNYWAVWRDVAGHNCTHSTVDQNSTVCGTLWTDDFTSDCAECVCRHLKGSSICSRTLQIIFLSLMAGFFAIGTLYIGMAVFRINDASASYDRQDQGMQVEGTLVVNH